MSATVRDTKKLTTLDLSIRTLKPRSAVTEVSEASEKARVVVVTAY
ncbi:MAG: hypothetical protein JWN04_1316 [Myxococcaceae bacterium]|nr:hypothetical protein [Myxococcaceae bacterium]